MTPFLFLVVVASVVVGYEALQLVRGVSTTSAASSSGSSSTGATASPQSGGTGTVYTAQDVYSKSIALGFTPAQANTNVFLANRESGFGSLMGPTCCATPNTKLCPDPPFAHGFETCKALGNEAHYGIFQWGELSWPAIWAIGNCLGNLDCELAFLKKTVDSVGYAPWNL